MDYLGKTDYPSIPDSKLAATVMAELKWHREQDNLLRGQYWEDGKGCAVGCLLKGDNHEEYPEAFGIPIMLAQLEDRFFEGVTKKRSVVWPEEFMGACMAVGKTRKARMKKLGVVGWQLLHWVLTDELPKTVVGDGEIYDNVRKAIAQCADALLPLTKGKKVNKKAARAAAYASHATLAATDAAYAAAYAADAAYAAARAAADAARAAAAYASHATLAATDAAYAAAYAANAAYAASRAAAYATYAAADAAYAAARAAAYERMADKLLQLINEAKDATN
jgi:hypothetical protein